MKNTLLNEIAANLRIVMVETTHPGNIGAAARAMKNMGQRNLYLVKPKIFPSAEVTARAAGADDILARAVVCGSLQDALQDCVLVVATTARSRTIPWPVNTPRECAPEIINATASGQVAVVFGRESSGLNNEELELCNMAMQIPTDPDFSSLNVASAIQIICYEILQTIKTDSLLELKKEESPPASTEQMRLFYAHLEQTMIASDFLNPQKPKLLMQRIRRLFGRARLEKEEVQILRGILTALGKRW